MELAVVAPAPMSIETLSERLATSSLIPSSLQGRPSDVMVIVLTGQELGLSPMQSIRSINVIDGKPVLDAALIVALVKRSSACEEFRLVESTNERATYETRRRGESASTRMTYSLADAKAAGLSSKQNWQKHPAAMLRARCSAALGRAVYPDVVLNIYDQDEGEEIQRRRAPVREPDAIDVAEEAITAPRVVDFPIDDAALPEPTPEEDAAATAKAEVAEDIATLRAVLHVAWPDEPGNTNGKTSRKKWCDEHGCSKGNGPLVAFAAKPRAERLAIIETARESIPQSDDTVKF
jgi:hypothetical protein